jgi:LPS sulfotransferase NodH
VKFLKSLLGRKMPPMHLRDDSYMICCPARSGSSMFVHLLRSHPQILSHGEVLGRTVTGFAPPLGTMMKDNPALQSYFNSLKDSEPLYFIYNHVLHPRGRQAVGFKLKYDELSTKPYRTILDIIRQDRDLKILFLDRENLFERYLSHRVADKTGVTLVTARTPQAQPEMPVLTLDPVDMEKSFREELDRKAHFRRIFAGHRSIETTYEKLVADPTGEMDRIYAFIGVPPHAATTTTKKIVDRDLSRVVTNLPELKAHFAGTPFAVFFDA